MKVMFKVEAQGFKELDQALGELPKATARNTMRRALMLAAKPMVDLAKSLVPVWSGDLRDSIAASAKLANKAGSAEYHAAMKAGLGTAAAVDAMRTARREAGGSFTEIYVGAGQLPHAHLVEFGSVHNTPHPYMRPAWDQSRQGILDTLKTILAQQIAKAVERAARKAAREAAKLKR